MDLILIFCFFGFFSVLLQKNNKFNVVSAISFSIVFLIIHVFRDISYGEDSINYYNNFFLIAHESISVNQFFSDDIIFKLINYIMLIFGSSWYYYAFSMGLFCLFLIIKINDKIANNNNNNNSYLFLVLILISPIFLENTLNILRTTVCSLIMFYGYLSLDKNKKYGLFIILLGFLTHYLQGVIIFSLFLFSKLNLIKSNKVLNFFVFAILIFTILKNYILAINYDILINQLSLLKNFMSDNANANYTINQIIGSQDFMTTSIFFQLLLYSLIPLYLINFESLNSTHKQTVNYIVISIIIYVFLYPQLSFTLRLIPIVIISSLYLFSLVNSNFKITYSIVLLFFNIFVVLNNFIFINS